MNNENTQKGDELLLKFFLYSLCLVIAFRVQRLLLEPTVLQIVYAEVRLNQYSVNRTT